MRINLTLNGKKITEEIAPDLLLIDFVRNHKCYSVKRGCETANCGLCTVFLDGKPVLSCGGMIMNAIALFRENPEPSDEEIKEYLAGNLCRCSGYEGQLRAIHAFLEYKKQGGAQCIQ